MAHGAPIFAFHGGLLDSGRPTTGEGMKLAKEWCCSFCDRDQLLLDGNTDGRWLDLYIGKTVHGPLGLHISAIRCLNPACNELTLAATLFPGHANNRGEFQPASKSAVARWQLRPESISKPQPDYIPAPIREDYFEACLIRDKSPKASATLARRCLQGMIRDFCGISKKRLVDEIAELRKRVEEGSAPKGVEAETVEAIDHVRNIGNIGAHMGADISLIVDVDPGEAQALIDLIEMLFVDWYVARYVRQERLDRLKQISKGKDATIKGGRKEKEAEEAQPERIAEAPTEAMPKTNE